MICYRDMTFCNAKDCAKFANCERALTDEVIQRADDANLLISVTPKMECYEPKKDENKHEPQTD